MVNLLIVAIFILPWLVIPNNNLPDPTRLIKSTFFDLTLMGVIFLAISQGVKFQYKNKYLGWVALAVFFGFGCNWYYPLLMGYGYNAGTIEANLHFLLALIATFCVCSTLERNDFVRLSKAIVCSATLVASFALLQVIGLDPMKHLATYSSKESRHVCALLDHPDVLGNYLALAVPFVLYLFRPKYIVPFGIIASVLFFTHSSISMVAALVSVLIFLGLRFRNSKIFRFVWIGLALGFVSLCFNPHFNKLNGGFTGRLEAWQTIFNRSNNPIFGQGLAIVKSYNVKFWDNYWNFAHNDYLEIYCSGGIILIILFILLVIHSIRNFDYKEDNVLGFAYLGSFVAFLILMFGSFPMEIAPLALGGLVSWWGLEKLR